MKLYELGTGEPVQVLVKVENASAEYDSTVAFWKRRHFINRANTL